ncbi:DoxX family protein [Blastococcus sp. SYSU DS0753]
MNIALWIITALLAAVFLAVGLMKLTQPKPALVEAGQGWAEDVPDTGVKAIGALEVLGALGLILPALLDTATVLVPLAAVGLAILMLGAAVTHARRREYPNILANVILAALAIFVAVQRFGEYAF